MFNQYHGGKREGAGRPSKGTRRSTAIVLYPDLWDKVDGVLMYEDLKLAEYLRDLVIADLVKRRKV